MRSQPCHKRLHKCRCLMRDRGMHQVSKMTEADERRRSALQVGIRLQVLLMRISGRAYESKAMCYEDSRRGLSSTIHKEQCPCIISQ